MKKKVLLVLSFIFLCCSLSGCEGRKQSSEVSENQVAETGDIAANPEENGVPNGNSTSDGKNENSEVQSGASDNNIGSNTSGTSDASPSSSDEILEGEFPGGGNYKLTNSSNAITMEYASDDSTCIVKYDFSDGKVSNFSMVEKYNNEETAKKSYDDLKNNDFIKENYKELKLNGSEISYVAVDSYIDGLKQQSKDEIFKNLKDSVSVQQEQE